MDKKYKILWLDDEFEDSTSPMSKSLEEFEESPFSLEFEVTKVSAAGGFRNMFVSTYTEVSVACLYLFQNELPNYSLKSNKLDGSFFFYPRTNFFVLASCTTLSVLCKSFQRTLSLFAFLELFSISFCLRFRSFSKADAKV